VPRADVRGASLEYELSNTGGATVAFLNGIAMSIAHWAPVAEPLSRRYRCLCHDMRGQLRSPRAAGAPAIRLEDHVEDLRALLDTLAINRVHLVGTSYGAEVAMLFAAAHPEASASLVVIDGVSELDPLLRATAESWKAAALADPVVFYRTILPWNYSAAFIAENSEMLARREQAVARLPRGWFEDFAALCDAFLALDITPRLSSISCPTLVLVAEKDILKHEGFARIIAGRIRGAVLRGIGGAGHAVVIEKPDAVRAEVEDFLAALPGG
jgi:3-oxoadipate enol-lactonase